METNDEKTVAQLGALAQATRLAVFKTLIRQGPEGMAAGRIATGLSVAPNTLSAHLSVLQRAGLIRARRSGRSMIYSAELTSVAQLIGTLVHDCCNGHPDACAALDSNPLNIREPACA